MRCPSKSSALILIILLTNVAIEAVAGDWVGDGLSLNVSAAQNGITPAFAVSDSNQTPYVAWCEGGNSSAYQLYVKHLSSGAWVQDGSGSLNVNPACSAGAPRIGIGNGTIWAAWEEWPTSAAYSGNGNVQVKSYSGGVWQVVGGGTLNLDLNSDAGYPDLAVYNGTPYVAWREGNIYTAYQIYVKRLNGTNWEQVGGSVNVDPNQNAYSPKLAVGNNMLFVAWSEGGPPPTTLFVKHLNGSSWVQDGGNVNASGLPDMYSLSASVGDVPFVSWRDSSRIIVKRFYGGIWDQFGSQVNDSNAVVGESRVRLNGLNPSIAWSEQQAGGGYQIRVKHFGYSDWVQDGSALNVNSSQSAYAPDMCFCAGVPYAVWSENGQVYAKHFDPNYVPPTPTATVTPTPAQPTNSASANVLHRRIEPRLGEKTIISYNLSHGGQVSVKIYDLLGNLMKSRVDSNQNSGYYTLEWDAKDELGDLVASGVYIVHVKTPETTLNQKVIVIK